MIRYWKNNYNMIKWTKIRIEYETMGALTIGIDNLLNKEKSRDDDEER